MQVPSHLLIKIATLVFSAAMGGLFIAYQTGAFRTTPGKLQYEADMKMKLYRVRHYQSQGVVNKKFHESPQTEMVKFNHISSSKTTIATGSIDYWNFIGAMDRLAGVSGPFGMAAHRGFIPDPSDSIENKK